MIDDGNAVHYSAVRRGTPVYDSDDAEIGRVREIRDNYAERILDGIVVDTASGSHFVDAPEVARTAERAVTLSITGAQVEQLPPPRRAGILSTSTTGRRLSRFLKRSPS